MSTIIYLICDVAHTRDMLLKPIINMIKVSNLLFSMIIRENFRTRVHVCPQLVLSNLLVQSKRLCVPVL